MVRTRVGVLARVLAITALLGVNLVVGVHADDACYECRGGCSQVSQGQLGHTDCIPLGDSCFLDGNACQAS
jgi:hypothetical protein